jgi:putative MFS transporter
MSTFSTTAATHGGAGTTEDVASRIERLPSTRWQVKIRMMIGTATFFDAFDALTIAQVLPALIAVWRLDAGQIGLLISVGYLGQLVGALAMSAVAERRGRVQAMVAAIIVFSVMSVLCAFAPSFALLLVFRTVQGIGLGAQVPIAAVYISELARAHGRGRFVLLYELIFSVGVVAAGLVGFWVVPHLGWRYMFTIGALPILLVFFILHYVPESPRWLASRGHHDRADTALTRIEQHVQAASGGPLPPPAAVTVDPGPTRSTSWLEIFRGGYARRTLVVWTMWFAAYLVYYGISTWMPTLYRTVFKLDLTTALGYGLIGNVAALLGAASCAFLIDHVGRRVWFTGSLALTGLILGILAAVGANTATIVLVLGSAAYFFASSTAIGLYLYTPELYPTRVRALGVGTATAWLRIASILGPLVIGALVAHGLSTIFVIFGAISLVTAVFVAAFAVETKQAVLEELSP